MSTEGTVFQQELAKTEVIAGLQHALDCTYRGICEEARRDWERLIGEKDPSDACVTVRIAGIVPSALRGSGFLKSRPEPISKARGLPRFAQ